MSNFDPRSLLTYSLLPTLVVFLTGIVLLLFALGTGLATPALLIGGGLLGGFLLTKRFNSQKPKP
jgi:hypothetical protein